MRLLLTLPGSGPMLAWAQRSLLAIGVGLLGYCGFVFADAWAFQRSESGKLEQLLAAPPRPSVLNSPVATGGLIGRLQVPRLGLSVMVVEGSSSTILRRAAGHISGTGLPGQTGNIGISAHRDTFFLPLRHIRPDDLITLSTLHGEFRYRVVATSIVKPSDVSVLQPGDNEILTLVTCYPFYFVGSAPDRFIVRAARIV